MTRNSISPENFIGANLHVKLTDSRLLEGILTVIDPFGNLLLSNVYETSIDRINKEELHVRDIGLVSVPRERIESIKVDKKTHKNLFG
ncbi:MAK31 N-alpha-acetyltransferase 38 [Candida maltosa Xu316]